MPKTPIHLFVLGMPYSGTTMLWRLIGTSPSATLLPTEGQAVPGARELMRVDHWRVDREIPWAKVRRVWERHWDADKPVRVEKSPPNLIRASQIEEHFDGACFVLLMREPYAFVEGFARRKKNTTHRDAARQWVEWATMQRDNLAKLEHTLLLRYEDIAAAPQEAAEQLVQFEPLLESIEADVKVRCHSIAGAGDRQIVNFNAMKRELLSQQARRDVQEELAPHKELLAEFGYASQFPAGDQSKPRLNWLEWTRLQLRRAA